MDKPELHGLTYSSWTEKAKWALDHHRISYRYREHLVIFGEAELRLKLRRFIGGVTVPALIAKDARLMDSHDIARYADAHGSGTRLFPPGKDEEIRRFNAIGEAAADAGRALAMARMADDQEFKREMVPPFISGFLRRASVPLVSLGLAYIGRAFRVDSGKRARAEAIYREALKALRTALAHGGGAYALGEFSYADVIVATALQGVVPPADEYLRMSPAARRCWTSSALAAEFAELVAWRDGLYRKHRPKRVG